MTPDHTPSSVLSAGIRGSPADDDDIKEAAMQLCVDEKDSKSGVDGVWYWQRNKTIMIVVIRIGIQGRMRVVAIVAIVAMR
jgi:hypothetical protein